MRPNNQQKNRARGRNNNNNNNNNNGRKNLNPMSRNFESNGPDIKIRGNASHIAEKYVQLARDAQSVGDSVMEQNYLQHAEHYFRIISAAQASQAASQARNDADRNDGDNGDREPHGNSGMSGGNTGYSGHENSPASGDRSGSDMSEPGDGDGDDLAASEVTEIEAAPAPKPRREPRPRKRIAPDRIEGSGDPASAPQPDIGDLPAFIRTPTQTDAAE